MVRIESAGFDIKKELLSFLMLTSLPFNTLVIVSSVENWSIRDTKLETL